MLDRQHLAILHEVARLGSVTAAAARLNLTQSALSHKIRKLEERYEIAVWQREGRQLRLTHAGQYLAALARRILPQLERAEAALVEFQAGQQGSLIIGMECHPCHQWLMRVVRPFLGAWPDIDIELKTAFSFGGVAALADYDIDILITPDPVDRPNIRYTPVFDYELVLAIPESHVLTTREFAGPADLSKEVLITYPVPPERLDVFTQFLIPGHCRPRRHRTAETTEMMLQLVAAGRGVSAVPDWLLRQQAADLPIRALRIGRNGIHKSIHLGVRDDEDRTGCIAGFLDISKATGNG